ncbi:MAG: hypothetical protein KGR26_02145 [Cyanobacteria bacterium REEB65]|nr:hypothetical protein [Cyanobacteria bacterium REEB65]
MRGALFDLGIQGGCLTEEPPRARDIALAINAHAGTHPVFRDAKREGHPEQNTAWRIAPEPFCLSADFARYLETLGNHLLAFYRACNKLYFEAIHGRLPGWVTEYLDLGKPDWIVDYGRMNRFKNQLPGIIRPDLIVTDTGRTICCELDTIPGGMGFVGSMAKEYTQFGYRVIGGEDGMVTGFARMLREQAPQVADPLVAIVVSQEASDYWAEMRWMGQELARQGLRTVVCRPEELRYSDDGMTHDGRNVDVLYRFFELFDLKNIPKSELIMYAAKKQRIAVSPPFKAFLEEKLLFALFHHPALGPYWKKELSPETFAVVAPMIPRTWILDPRPIPPHACIPRLLADGRQATSWDDLLGLTKKGRQFVIKPSGFSALAWGSRGVSFGHDLSSEEWAKSLQDALASFDKGTPYVLQEFHKPAKLSVRYYHFGTGEVVPMTGRARICPYYYVVGDRAELSGILVTVCPADKLAIHGMIDSVMVPARADAGPNVTRLTP